MYRNPSKLWKRFFFFFLVFSGIFGVVALAQQTPNQKVPRVKEKEFDFWKAAFYKNPFPEKLPQPINFPHNTHVQKLGLDCKFCHYYVEKSKYAGVPSVADCMGCHRYVSTVMEKPDIKKLFQYYEKGEPIPWLKVHNLPDFVRFTHRMHVNAGVECYECHGDVASMDTAQRVAPLSMDWCLNCHRQRNASTECYTCHY